MQLRTRALKGLKPAPYNPRVDLRPGDPEYEHLKRSIQEFGCVLPLVVNATTGHVVGGHQRLHVLKDLGYKDVRVVQIEVSLAQEKALNLALNKISGHWDEARLAELLQELVQTPDFDLAVTGFELPEVEDLLTRVLDSRSGFADEDFDLDAAFDAEGNTITQPGDLIELGEHRLLCGDATLQEDVQRLMGRERAVLFSTDPPYQVGYDGSHHPAKQRGRRRTPKCNWDDPAIDPDLYDHFIQLAVESAIDKHAAWYMWHASRNQAKVEAAWTRAGALLHQQILWVKEQSVLNRSWYLWQHEPCFFGWLQGNKPRRVAKDKLSTVWKVPGLRGIEHPTAKPLRLFEIPMLQHTVRGDLCYEPFAGSGSQLIAAEHLGRRCYATEKDPRYCDLIVRRWLHAVGPARVPRALAARYLRNTSDRPKEKQHAC